MNRIFLSAAFSLNLHWSGRRVEGSIESALNTSTVRSWVRVLLIKPDCRRISSLIPTIAEIAVYIDRIGCAVSSAGALRRFGFGGRLLTNQAVTVKLCNLTGLSEVQYRRLQGVSPL